MSKRIFFMAMVLFLVLTLAACQRPDNTPMVIVTNNPIGSLNTTTNSYDKLVYTKH